MEGPLPPRLPSQRGGPRPHPNKYSSPRRLGSSSPGRAPGQPSYSVPSAGPFSDVSVHQIARDVHKGSVHPSVRPRRLLRPPGKNEIRDHSVMGGKKGSCLESISLVRRVPANLPARGRGLPGGRGRAGVSLGEGEGPGSPQGRGVGAV